MTTLRTNIDTLIQSPTARRVLGCLLRCCVSVASDRFYRTTQTPCPRN